MTIKDVFQQARVNEYDDTDLLKYIGFLYEELKSLDERMKNDENIEKLAAALKEYKDEHYLDQKKVYRSCLKAARVIAQARGLKFDPPTKEAFDDG